MAALSCLPNELLCYILGSLSAEDVCSVASTCRSLKNAADMDCVWEVLAMKTFGVDVRVAGVRKGAVRRFYLRVLRPYGRYLGLWQRRNVNFYGSLHQMLCDSSGLHLVQWLPPVACRVEEPLRKKNIISLLVSDEDGQVTRVMHDDFIESTDFGISLDRDWETTEDRMQLLVHHVPDFTTDPHLWRQHVARLTQEETGGSSQENQGNHLRMLKYTELYYERHRHVFHKLSLPRASLGSRTPILPGLFKGTYSLHGIELIALDFDLDEGVFRGTKVTGDPNVPFGEVSFSGKLCQALLVGSREQDDMESLLALTRDESAHADWRCQTPWRDSIFRVPRDCHADADVAHRFASCSARFACACQVAGHGHLNPEFINGNFIVLNEDWFAVVFIEIHNLSFYHRVTEMQLRSPALLE